MQELEIEALPKNLPHELRVDLSGLQKFEDRLLVKNILLPNGVKILAGTEEIIALVEPPRSETELEELKKAEAAPGTVAEVKTEKEVKATSERALQQFFAAAREERLQQGLGIIGRARVAFGLQQQLIKAGYPPALVKQVLFAMLLSAFVGR